MNNKQRNQILILLVLLLTIGIANYYNYFKPLVPDIKEFDFLKMSKSEQIAVDKAEAIKAEEILSTNKDSKNNSENTTQQSTSSSSSSSSFTSSGNYLKNAVDNNGKLIKWNKKQIYIFVQDSPYKSSIYNAFASYNAYFKDYFKFMVVRKPEMADILVYVVNKFDSNRQNEMYMAGITNTSFNSKDMSLSSATIQLLSTKPNSAEPVTNNEIYKVAMHEIGHALGIAGHSQDSRDVMYGFSTKSTGTFTNRDITTIKMLYSNNPALTKDVTAGFSESKLYEAIAYTKKVPNKTISWINLARTYYEQGNLDEALKAYKNALMIDAEDANVYQSMAECYYNSKKYDTAIKYYQKAVLYSKDQTSRTTCENMIGVCYAKKEDYASAYSYFDSTFSARPHDKQFLYNLLLACVELNKKVEAKEAIERYKNQGMDISNDKNIQETLNWAK